MLITLRTIMEAVSATSLSQVLRKGVAPSKTARKKKVVAEDGLNPRASFKRKYGILSKAGKKKKPADRVDSDWGFPLPPAGDPRAKAYARAVISRAHQGKNYDAAELKAQVKKAKAILAKAKAAESGRRIREWGVQADGSWEQQSQLIQKAAQRSDCFGAYGSESNWAISLWASYPAKSAVIIANTTTGELWAATYAIDDSDNVTFPTVVKAKQIYKAAA